MSLKNKQFGSLLGVRAGIALAAAGWLMKIMHCPGANILFTVGCIVLMLAFILRTYYKKNRGTIDWFKLLLVTCFIIRGIVGNYHLPFPNFIWVSIGIIIPVIFVFIVIRKPKSLLPSSLDNSWTILLFTIAMIGLIGGAFFKIMHWPMAGILLVSGNIAFILWLILEPFFNSSTASPSYNSKAILDDFEEDSSFVMKEDNSWLKNHIFHIIAILLVSLGLLFKLYHWPGSTGLIILGLVIGTIDFIESNGR